MNGSSPIQRNDMRQAVAQARPAVPPARVPTAWAGTFSPPARNAGAFTDTASSVQPQRAALLQFSAKAQLQRGVTLTWHDRTHGESDIDPADEDSEEAGYEGRRIFGKLTRQHGGQGSSQNEGGEGGGEQRALPFLHRNPFSAATPPTRAELHGERAVQVFLDGADMYCDSAEQSGATSSHMINTLDGFLRDAVLLVAHAVEAHAPLDPLLRKVGQRLRRRYGKCMFEDDFTSVEFMATELTEALKGWRAAEESKARMAPFFVCLPLFYLSTRRGGTEQFP